MKNPENSVLLLSKIDEDKQKEIKSRGEEFKTIVPQYFRDYYSSFSFNNLDFFVEEVAIFNTWFNNNIATIIVKIDNSYLVFLGLIDNRKIHLYPTNPFYQWWGKEEYKRKKHISFNDALQESDWLQKQLKEHSNPILLVHPLCDLDSYFHDIVCKPYVKIEILRESDTSTSISNNELNNIINKLQIGDIVAFKLFASSINNYYHFEIYLGDGRTIGMSEKYDGVRFSSIEENIKENIKKDKDKKKISFTGKIVKIHPIIPFKRIEEIIKHALINENYLWENQYDLENRNCQHFANSVVLGINYSEEIELKKTLLKNNERNYNFIGSGIFLMLGEVMTGTILGIPSLAGGLLMTSGLIGLAFSSGSGLNDKEDLDYLNNSIIKDRSSRLKKIVDLNKTYGSIIEKMNLFNNKINETNNLLEKSPLNSSNYNERKENICRQYTNQLEKEHSINECIIM